VDKGSAVLLEARQVVTKANDKVLNLRKVKMTPLITEIMLFGIDGNKCKSLWYHSGFNTFLHFLNITKTEKFWSC
jgi:hypothetical protein